MFQAVNFGQYPLRAPTQFVCWSADKKETTGRIAGDHCLEIDTGHRFIFLKTSATQFAWVQLPDSPEYQARQQTELLRAILEEVRAMREEQARERRERLFGPEV